MKLSEAKKAQIDIMTKVLGHERILPPAHTTETFPRFRPLKAWLNADPLKPNTRLKDVDARRVIGVAISLAPKGKPDAYGILLLCQRKTDMTGALITRALGYAPKAKVIFTGPVRMAWKKKPKKKAATRAKTAKKSTQKKKKKKAQSAAQPATEALPKTMAIGDSVSRDDSLAQGTVGCFVSATGRSGVYILSNNHVLAALNAGQPADAILSPSQYDGGAKPGDHVADLDDFIPIDFGSSTNDVDCALAKLHADVTPDRVNVAGFPAGKKQISGQIAPIPQVLTRVRKRGAGTGVSVGNVWAGSLTGGMWAEEGAYTEWFCATNQLLIDGKPSSGQPTYFAWHGDSGAVAFNDDVDAVGLIFAVSDEGGQHNGPTTVANPMEAVRGLLHISL